MEADSFCRCAIQQGIKGCPFLAEDDKNDFYIVPEDNLLEDFLQTVEETDSPDRAPEQTAMVFICKRFRLNYGKLSEENGSG